MIFRCFLIFLSFSTAVFAQDENSLVVEAQVQAKSFYMGQAFTYSILVDGSNKVKPPFINKISGFALKKTEERALKSADKPGFVIRYELAPLQSGNLTIPEIPIEVDGKEYLTKEFNLSVKKPQKHPGLKLSVLVSQSEVYVGEPFLATFIWESEIPLYTLKAVDVELPLMHDVAFKSIPPFNAPSGGSKGTIGLPVSNMRMICSHDIFERDGKRVETLKFKKVVRAQYSGELELKPATLLCSFIPPSQKEMNYQKKNRNWKPNYPSYFNNDFFEKTGNVKHNRYIAESASTKITVKDLPVDGRPDDFYGLIGKCTVETIANPVILESGAPLYLKIKMAGYDFPSVLTLPDFTELSTFNRSFSIPKQKSNGEYEKSTKIYTQTLRPLRTDVKAIPAVRIPYFDPQTGTYNVAQSKEISITVKPAGKVTAFDAELSSDTRLKNRLLDNPHGIRHNNLSTALLNKRPMSLLTIVLLAFFIPAFLFFIFLLVTKNSRLKLNDPAKFQALNAWKNFKSSRIEKIDHLETATRNYFAARLNIMPDAHTQSELINKLSLSESDVQTLRKLYQVFDSNRFGESPGSSDLNALKQTAVSLIQKIEGEFKNV